MKRPKTPPRPKPIVPEMTVFTGHDSMPACICSSMVVRAARIDISAGYLPSSPSPAPAHSFPASDSRHLPSRPTAMSFRGCSWREMPSNPRVSCGVIIDDRVKVGALRLKRCRYSPLEETEMGNSHQKRHGDLVEQLPQIYFCGGERHQRRSLSRDFFPEKYRLYNSN